LIVQGWVIIEVKVVQARDSAHVAKCLNCIARHETGDLLLVDFGKEESSTRLIMSPWTGTGL